MEYVDFSAFLVLSAIGVAYMANCRGLFVVFWSFRIRSWVNRQKTTWTTKGPALSNVRPCPSNKGPKDRKDHACNTGTDGEH